MKGSLFALLPLACFVQSALAAPAPAVEAKSMVGPPITSSELVERGLEDRGLLSGLLGGLGFPVNVPDLTTLPELSRLSLLVTTVVNTVKAIDDTVAGANGKNITNIVPTLTDQITVLQTTLGGLQAALSGISDTTLSLTQIAGVSVLLARLFNALATGIAQITTLAAQNVPGGALNPLTQLVGQLFTSLTSAMDLNLLSPGASS